MKGRDFLNFYRITIGRSPNCSSKYLGGVPEEEQLEVLKACHLASYGGHYSSKITAFKVLQSGFYWPNLFKDAHDFYLK